MYTRAKLLLVVFLFSWTLIPGSASADDVALTGTISFGALDGSAEDHDGTVNGVFTVNDGDLVIEGTVQCNDDPPLPGNAGACPIAINVSGDLIVEAGGGLFAENRLGGGEGGDISLTVGGALILNGPSGALPGAVVSSSRLTGKDSAGDVTLAVQGDVTLEAGTTIAASTPNGSSGAVEVTAGGTVSLAGLVASGPSRQVLGTKLTGKILEGGESKQTGGAILIRSTGALGIHVEGSGIIVSQGESSGSQLVLLEACGIEIRGLVASMLKQNGPSQVVLRSGEGLLIDGRDLGSPEPNPGRLGRVRADGTEGGSAGYMVDLFANGDIEVLGPASSTLFAVSSSPGSQAQRSGGAITAISLAGTLTASGNAFEAGKENTGNQGGIIDLQAKGNAALDGATLRAVGDFVTTAPSRKGGSISVRSYQGSLSWTFGVGDVRPTGSGVSASRRGTITLTACSGIDTTGTQFPTVGSAVLPFPVENDGVCSPSAPTLPSGEPPLPVCNQAPVVTTTAGAAAFTEDGGPVVVDSGVTVMDDDANLASATVTITNPQDGAAEVLSATSCAGLMVTPGLNSLSITGNQPVATYQSCLQSVTYDNTSQNPDTTTRVIAFVASDGTASSAAANRDVTVTASNDAPVVTTTAGTTGFTEDGGPVVVDSGVMVVDDDDANLESARVSLASAPDGAAEVLNATNCGSLTVAPGDPLTISGTATVATYQTCLRSVTYNNTSQSPNTANRTVNFVVNDGDSDSNTAPKTLSVTAVNDAPVVTTTVGTTSFTEDGGAVVVDALVAVSDDDDTNLELATVSLASAPDGAAEVLNATNCGSLMVASGNPLAISGTATVAVYQTCLQSVTYNNSSQNPNTTNRTVNFLVNDGESNSNTAPKTVSVTAVNDAPTANPDNQWDTIGNTRLIVAASDPGQDADGPYVFVAGNVLANDMDPDGPAASLTAMLANANGATVTINSDGTFTYVPPPGAVGPTHSFTYNAFDGLVNSVGTVTIDLVSRVWYVKNDDDGGTGVSNDPFATLAEAQTASVAGDTIYVFAGNGVATGQDQGIVLKANQRLIGEGVQLDVPGSVNGGPDPTVLRDAGDNSPAIDNINVGGHAVSATDAIPARIAGLSLIGSANAIDITTNGAFGGSGSLTIANNTIDNTVRPGGAEGIDINLGGTGTIILAVHENNLTAAGTAIDITRTAGTVIIAALNDNTVSGDTGGSGIVVSGPATFDAMPGGALDPVGGGITVIGDSVNPVTGSGLTLGGVTGALDFADLDVFAGGAGVVITGTGAFTGAAGTRVTVPNGVSIVQAGNGPGVDVANATIDLRLSTLTVSASPTTGVSLVNVSDGTVAPAGAFFSAGPGSTIANVTGTDFNVDGGNGTISYGGSINNTAGRSVAVQNRTGDLVTFANTSTITDNGTGILVNANAAGAVTDFLGTLTMSTGTNAAFVATSGGTLRVMGAANTIATTTGVALNVTNTTIGAGNGAPETGLRFRSISAGTGAAGPANGIVLNNTGASGGLTVTGTGATGTGGTIQNCTGDGISLTSTRNVSLSWMNVTGNDNNGISGTSVTNLTLSDLKIQNNTDALTEAGLKLSNIFGVNAVTNTEVSGSTEDNVNVTNNTNSSTLTSLTFSGAGCSIHDNSTGSGNVGINIQASLTADMNGVVIDGCSFQGNRTVAIRGDAADTSQLEITVRNNVITAGSPNQGNQGIEIGAATSAQVTFFDIDSNRVGTNGVTNSPLINTGINVSAGGTAACSMTGHVRNNTVVNAGAGQSGFGIRVFQSSSCVIRANVTNNTVSNVGLDYGLLVESGGSAGSNGRVDAAVTNNNVSVLAGALDAIRTQARNASTMCARISGNTTNHPNDGGCDAGSTFCGLVIRQANTAAFSLEGSGGSCPAGVQTAAQAETCVESQNSEDTGEAFAATNFTGVATNFCTNIP